ncbi:hypothetical protein lerEdw1_006624 [Lerista edwardsae]|nr:hypothetical protein lerEdw1_006624 [Lerista edwardsae]
MGALNSIPGCLSLQDYPSIGHLAQVLSEANIQPIFAVTGPRLPIYEELSRLIPKSAVGELKEDSSNVVQLIADAYSVQFTVRVKATACLPRPQEVAFRVPGVGEELHVQLTTACECQCGDSQPHAHHCSRGHGNLTCGVCSCQEGYVGQLCECKKEDLGNLESSCRDMNYTGPVCSGKGQCVCGKCQCNSHASGPFCQCDDTSCERHNGQLCAAPTVNERWCQKKTGDGSLLIYFIEKDETGSISITVKDKTGSSKQTMKLILGLVVGLVAGLGLLLIGLYRGLIEIYDRQEFSHFKKECERAQWNEVNNPLFRSATTTTFNPKYNED